ncbi:hypothetical protein ENINMM134B_10095 [Enterobacter intestinihominis]|nr:hypothetical protein SK63_00572 [Enterobacter sp. BIDMC110]
MSVNTETASAQGQTTVLEKEGVYASLFEKINLTPASSLGDINAFLDDAALSDAPAGERLTAAMQVFMDCIRKSGQPVEKLDKTLIDHHIAELDFQISRQLDAVMHHQEFQNPDRPYIAGVLHDSAHGDHVTIRNYRRNVLRTPANNKIRLDDERGKEHIKVSTEYGGKSQLNLGHLVDSEKQQRGEGFELRTDSRVCHVAVLQPYRSA